MILVRHRDRPAALAGRDRLWLAAHVDQLPDGHPDKRLVAFKCLYARDVLTGQLPGPYRHADADYFAAVASMTEPPTRPDPSEH